MLNSPQSPSPIVDDWIERHRNPPSFALHLVGIPLTIIGTLLLPVYLLMWSRTTFLFALALFLGGFGLQFLGHAIDGTEPGEIRGLRTWWGRRRAAKLAGHRARFGG